MEYKVGDKVRVKSLDWYNEHENGKRCFQTTGYCNFVYEMKEYCGKVFTIHSILNDSFDGIPIIKLNGVPYMFIPDWFEQVCDDEKKICDDKKLESALRYNTGKPKWSLVHMHSLVPMIRVLEYGALKYEPFNWQKPMKRDELLDSMQRHLAALIDGNELDDESGLTHIGHIMANALFYSYHFVEKEK